MSKRKINKFLVLIAFIFILSSCSNNSDYTHRITNDSNVRNALDCSVEKNSAAKAACAEGVLKNTSDKWVRDCAIENIDEKEKLGKSLSNGTITDDGLKDIDGVLKECAYYKKKNEEYVSSHSNSHPIFSSFIGSTMGSFAGNYLYDSFSNRKKDSDNYTGGSTVGHSNGYVGKDTNSNTTKGSNPTNIEKIDTQHKKDNWNIKEMKKSSSSKGNYKLGNSGKNWSKVQSISKSRSSSSSSRSSWGSSSSRSSLG